MAVWSWRFDDPGSRQFDAIGLLADDETVSALTAAPKELQRRIDVGQVSWVIIRSIDVDGAQVTVRFYQHLVDVSSVEVVTARTVIVSMEDRTVVGVEVVL